MTTSEFIDVNLKVKCPKCGHEGTTSVDVDKDGIIDFMTFCGTPPHLRGKRWEWSGITGCGASIIVKGTWNYKIDSVTCD